MLHWPQRPPTSGPVTRLPRSLHSTTTSPAPRAGYYEDNGERRGSLDEAQMIELIRAGRLDRHTPVWKIGSADWQLLNDSELRSHLDSPVPPASSGRDVDDRSSGCWPVPRCSATCWNGCWPSPSTPARSRPNAPWKRHATVNATLALNLLLGVLDERRLKQTGHDTARLRGWVSAGAGLSLPAGPASGPQPGLFRRLAAVLRPAPARLSPRRRSPLQTPFALGLVARCRCPTLTLVRNAAAAQAPAATADTEAAPCPNSRTRCTATSTSCNCFPARRTRSPPAPCCRSSRSAASSSASAPCNAT